RQPEAAIDETRSGQHRLPAQLDAIEGGSGKRQVAAKHRLPFFAEDDLLRRRDRAGAKLAPRAGDLALHLGDRARHVAPLEPSETLAPVLHPVPHDAAAGRLGAGDQPRAQQLEGRALEALAIFAAQERAHLVERRDLERVTRGGGEF
ncbi:hypothetical protein QU38_01620, partial [Staphylococcus aureus]